MNGPGSSRFNPRSSDDIFAEFFGTSSSLQPRNPSARSSDDIFAEFFGTSSSLQPRNPSDRSSEDIFAEVLGTSLSLQPRKPPAAETKLPCTLQELYAGSTRKVKITRDVLKTNGQLWTESEILTIDVKPGWKKGTKITFSDKGNEQPNQLPADLVFVIDEKPHDQYTREGNDLLLHHKIDLVDALAGTTVNLKTLDGRDLVIKLTDVVTPGYELTVANEGMPIAKENGRRRGNLRIRFDVDFPRRLSSEQRLIIRKALSEGPHQQQ